MISIDFGSSHHSRMMTETICDRIDGDSSFLRAIFQYRPNEDFKLTLGAEHTNANKFFDRGVPIDDDGNFLIDPEINLTPSGLGHTDIQTTAVDLNLEYKLSDNWTLNHTTRFQNNRLEGDSISTFGVFQSTVDLGLLNPAFAGQFLLPFQTVTRTPVLRDFDNDLFTTRTEFKGKFNTGALSHESLFSVEYEYNNIGNSNRTDAGGLLNSILTAVDLQNLNIDLVNPIVFNPADPTDTTTHTFALGLFDKITVNDSLNFILGGRLDFIDTETDRESDGIIADYSENEFSPTVGMNYKFNEQFSAYSVYSESFNINLPDINGNVIDPRKGKNFELGVRYNIPNTRLTLNASVFDIEETNRPTTDPTSIAAPPESGTFESQGVDFTLQGEVNDNISLILNYVYNETELTNTTNPLALGSPAAGIPEHQASLFVNYDFAPSEAKGLRLNAGIVYVGERLDTVPTALFQVIEIGGTTLQDYIRVDVGARYDFDEHKSIGLRVENLFDENYGRASSNSNLLLPEAPRTVFLTFDWEF